MSSKQNKFAGNNLESNSKMPSKGVQVYSYTCVPDVQVEFQVPGQTLTKNEQGQFSNDHLEVDKKHLGTFNLTGQFKFKVMRNGDTITEQWVDVNTMTGNVEKGSMHNMFDQQSIVRDDVIVTYSFYDAGSGEFGLPGSHQCYVVVSPNHSEWMRQVAPPDSDKNNKPFWRFVLPAAHDIGMNSMETPDALVQKAGAPFVNILKFSSNVFSKIADSASSGVITAIAPNIISGLAVTQKDKVETVLAIGARYFEFRPARIHNEIKGYNCVPDEFYFTHGPIPGLMYKRFLSEIVDFLNQHTAEIVVVQLRWDGVPGECGRPSDEDLDNINRETLERANGSINIGSQEDMQNSTIADLRSSGKRLIILRNVPSLSTYTDEANATLNGDSIVNEFNNLNTDRQNGNVFTNIQCQATATNIRDVVIYSVMSADVSNSCILATKPICDIKTLPWIRDNALDRLQAEHNIVIMNDFFDGATADIAINLSNRRLEA